MSVQDTGQTEETPQMSASDAFLTNLQLMNQITHEMRETPEQPAGDPQDVHHLIRVEFPPHGGILTYMEGYDHPYKGYPIGEFVEKIDVLKKVIRNGLSAFYHRSKRRKLKWMVILVPWLAFDGAWATLYTLHRIVTRFKIRQERYCDALRELHRAFSFEFFDEKPEHREGRMMARDVICMVLEFDNAYRFRFQDIIVELEKEALKKRPARELRRLLTLMQSREQTQEVRDTWTLLKFFLPLMFFFNRPLKRNVVGVLGELDLEKLRLSVEDECFCRVRKDYQFGFTHVHN